MTTTEPQAAPEHGDEQPISLAKMLRYRATFPLPEGEAAFEFPCNLSPESCQEIRDWLELILKLQARLS